MNGRLLHMHTFAHTQKSTERARSTSTTKPTQAFPGPSRNVKSFLHLQRTIGNQAVLLLLQPTKENLCASSASNTSTAIGYDFSPNPVHASAHSNIQPKLKVNEPGDQYEREADHVVGQVMRMLDPQLQRLKPCVSGCASRLQRQADSKCLKINHVPASATNRYGVPPIVNEVLRSPGRPLDVAARTFFEPRFGHDFSRVRIHTDARAVQAAEMTNSLAFTVRQDIVFNARQYAPETTSGKTILAHELTHVVQQDGSRTNTANNPMQLQRLVRESRVHCPDHNWSDVAIAHSRGRRFVNNAIARTTTARDNQSDTSNSIVQQVRLALWRAFRLNPDRPRTWGHWVPLILQRLNGVMGHMDSVVYRFECLSIGETGRMPCGTCDPDPSNLAFICAGNPSTIALCPQFWALTDINIRAIALAHEVFHLAYAMIGDQYRLVWEPSEFPGINLPVRSPQPDITNAHCYAQFIALVNGFNVLPFMRCH